MSNNAPSAMNLYQQVIHQSRYARWREEDGRREFWDETIGRYVGYFQEHLAERCGYTLTEEESKEVYESLFNMETMPSMRTFMTAGVALQSCEVANYNCLKGDTKILTLEYGLVPIRDVAGQDVHVLTSDREWVSAPVRSFGKQETVQVDFGKLVAKTAPRKTVESTTDHRWLTDSGWKTTNELMVGDRVPVVVPQRPDTNNVDYERGLIHGIIYGDGTKITRRPNGKNENNTASVRTTPGYKIRVCGDHADITDIFERNGYVPRYYSYMDGDPVIELLDSYAKVTNLKELPEVTEGTTPSYILGFVRGWLAADGSVSANGQVTLCAGQEGLSWINRWGPVVGFEVNGSHKLPDVTNFGQRTHAAYSIRFAKHSVSPDDMIIARKRARIEQYLEEFYVVRDIRTTGVVDTVYCATVPTTQNFVIEGNLLTGNCSYTVVDNVRAFSEHQYVLMAGSGSGFSVERRFTEQLPEVPEELHPCDTIIKVADSRKGWCAATNQFLNLLYAGNIPQWDVSKIRPEGARLKTFGGYSSGPGVLVELFEFIIEVFKKARGRKLKPSEVFSIMCYIAQIVVVGGVRRSACICLFDKDDSEMRTAKSGAWYNVNPHYAMANISAVFESKPNSLEFLDFWRDLIASYAGEPGILNRKALWEQCEKFDRPIRYDDGEGERIPYGVNPCSEIILQPYSFCNLTGIVARRGDTLDDLKRKARIATIMGTWQATVTDFDYLRKRWKENADDERLLGVCISGVMDHEVLSQKSEESARWERELREYVWEVNREWAKKLGINVSASVTAIKPAGNSGELTNSSSGIHPRYSEHYIRTIRQSQGDPMTEFLKDNGIPWEISQQNKRDVVFSFPVKSPSGAITAKDMTALEQLEHWLHMKRNYATHTISFTCYVRDHEWPAVGAWVYDNFDEITGVSFLPYDDHTYAQAPYQPCTAEQYSAAQEKMPDSIDWSLLAHYEKGVDSTTVSQELACAGGACTIG